MERQLLRYRLQSHRRNYRRSLGVDRLCVSNPYWPPMRAEAHLLRVALSVAKDSLMRRRRFSYCKHALG